MSMPDFDNSSNKSIQQRFFSKLFFLHHSHQQKEIPEYYSISAHKHIDIRQLPEFGEVADEVIKQRRTYLSFDRLYTIFQALRPLKNKFKSDSKMHVAEIGVWRGGTSYFICTLLKKYDLCDKVTLHCFDTFEGHSSDDIRDQLDGPHESGGFNDTSYESVKQYLSKFNNVEILKGRFQDNANNVKDLSFFFVHLDVDIYEPTIYALDFFNNRLYVGGCIIVDDYGFNSCPGARKAVDDFLIKTNNFFPLHLLTGQCVLFKYKNELPLNPRTKDILNNNQI